jgi:hypothetical protein
MLRRLRAAWPGAARQQRWMPAGLQSERVIFTSYR